MDIHSRFLNDVNINLKNKVQYISKLDIDIVLTLFKNGAVLYVDNIVALYIIIRSLQHKSAGISLLKERYCSTDIHNDIVVFSHIDQLSLLEKRIRWFMFYLKQKQRYSMRYLPMILHRSKWFGDLSMDVLKNIGEKYLGITSKSIDTMTNILGVSLGIIHNIKLCHIEYYYEVDIWDDLTEQPNQQGMIEAEELKEYFMQKYTPSTKLIKFYGDGEGDGGEDVSENVEGDFSSIFLSFVQEKMK